MDTLKSAFAARLLRINAIKLQPNNPFMWASGWKSPFYCDNRKTLSYPELRTYVKNELVHAILEHFPEVEAEPLLKGHSWPTPCICPLSMCATNPKIMDLKISLKES